MEYFMYLPTEITLDILSRVPTESVLDCKLVSKSWNDFVHHPSFSKMHLNHLDHPSVFAADSRKLSFLTFTNDAVFYYFEYNENHGTTPPIQRMKKVNLTCPILYDTVVGSCNGLICFSDSQSVCISSPITKEVVVLPKFKTNFDFSFGYVCSTNEYKVVAISVSMADVHVHIYTLGSNRGWRNLGKYNFTNFPFRSNLSDQDGIFANGALYWLDNKQEKIVSFDLAEEKFGNPLSPPASPPDNNNDYGLGVLDGVLFYYIHHVEEYFYEIWLLKEKTDEKKGEELQSFGWSKELRVEIGDVLAVTKSGGVLIFGGDCLNIYDTQTSTSKSLVKFKNYFSGVIPHKNTFVSLKELGEKDIQVMESIEIEETKSHEELQEDAEPEFIYL